MSDTSNYIFYVRDRYEPSEIMDRDGISLLLVYDDWDDFGYKTLYTLYYYDKSRDNYEFFRKIGLIKILNINNTTTNEVIPRQFKELSDSFCSLGQEIQFYENIKEIIPNYTEVLYSLNDLVYNQGYREKFVILKGFKTSLIRYSEAEKVYEEGFRILNDIEIQSAFDFTYIYNPSFKKLVYRVAFKFSKVNVLPFRTYALIGKNGTGKTQFLAKLALDLSGEKEEGKEIEDLGENTFIPDRPLFSKVITVSYSAFDKFTRPRKDKKFSYKYCGLKGRDGNISSENIIISDETIDILKQTDRLNDLYYALESVLDENFASTIYHALDNYKVNDLFDSLSSGYTILAYVIIEIISSIERDTLILFDEPELHLHPNATTNLIRGFNKLLERHDSYAIFATHSPIVIQEIPSANVYHFKIIDDLLTIDKLDMECFGEDLTSITKHIFGTVEVQEYYKEFLEELSKKKSMDDIEEYFGKKLSFNALMFLRNLYEK